MLRDLRRSPTLSASGALALLVSCSPLEVVEPRSVAAAPTERTATSFSASAGDDDREAAPLSSEASLDEVRRRAAFHNPGVRAAYDHWRAAIERAPQARALPEPRFTYVEFIESIETRTGPQERSFALQQSFPWFGTLDLRGSVAERRAAVAWERFVAARAALDHDVRVVWADFYWLGRAVAITEANLELLVRLERVARGKLAAGAENHPDVIRLQVEMGRLEDRLRRFRDGRRPILARLNALLARPADADMAWPESLPPLDVPGEDEAVGADFVDRSPELRALSLEVEAASLGRELAGKEWYPDMAVGVQTIATGDAVQPTLADSGSDPWMVSLSLELPLWWSKYRAGEREADAEWRSTSLRKVDVERRLVAELESGLYELRDASRRVELYGATLVRKAEESLASTEAAFRADTSDFLDLIDAERVLLEFRLEEERARADGLRARAKVDRLLGVTGPVSEDVALRAWERDDS